MRNDHEAVLVALLRHLENAAPGFQLYSRRLKFWDQTETQPALFLRHTGTEDEWQSGLGSVGPITTLEAEIWIYSRAGENPSAAPDTALNELATKVRCAFDPDDPQTGRFTLGRTVHWCRIEGTSLFDPGDIDKQGKAVIPVKITLPLNSTLRFTMEGKPQ